MTPVIYTVLGGQLAGPHSLQPGEILQGDQVDLGRGGGPDQTGRFARFVRVGVLRPQEVGDRLVLALRLRAEDIIGVFGKELDHPGLVDGVHEAGERGRALCGLQKCGAEH